MPNRRHRAVAAAVASAMLAAPALSVATAHADPLPGFCLPADVIDDVCTVRLASVTDEVVDGTITGAPVNGGAPVTLAGPEEAYEKSAGFGDARPDPVRQWDETIDSLSGLRTDPAEPNWYGNAKARVFMSRTLNALATQFPANTLMVSFTPDDTTPGTYRLVSIQPTPR